VSDRQGSRKLLTLTAITSRKVSNLTIVSFEKMSPLVNGKIVLSH